jgi:hypothetical protein
MRRRRCIVWLSCFGTIGFLLTGPAPAQYKPGLNFKTDPPPLTPEEKARRKNIDDAYRSALETLPDQKKPTDPWGGVRTTTPPPKKRQQ